MILWGLETDVQRSTWADMPSHERWSLVDGCPEAVPYRISSSVSEKGIWWVDSVIRDPGKLGIWLFAGCILDFPQIMHEFFLWVSFPSLHSWYQGPIHLALWSQGLQWKLASFGGADSPPAGEGRPGARQALADSNGSLLLAKGPRRCDMRRFCLASRAEILASLSTLDISGGQKTLLKM